MRPFLFEHLGLLQRTPKAPETRGIRRASEGEAQLKPTERSPSIALAFDCARVHLRSKNVPKTCWGDADAEQAMGIRMVFEHRPRQTLWIPSTRARTPAAHLGRRKNSKQDKFEFMLKISWALQFGS